MKKSIFTLIVIFGMNLSVVAQQPLTRDSLAATLAMADDEKSVNEAHILALQNPQLLEEILFIPKEVMDNGVARSNAFVYLLECTGPGGPVTKEYFFGLAFRLIKDINKYAFPDQVEGELAYYRGQLANYGFDPVLKINHLSALDSLKAFLVCLDALFSNNLIDNEGVFKSLKAKVSNAQQFLEKQKKEPAINILTAAINEVEAQKNKHLTTDAYYILKMSCEKLIEQIRITTF